MSLPLCACGCGRPVRDRRSIFLRNHHNRDRPFVNGVDYEIVDTGYETPCHLWLRYRKHGYAHASRAGRARSAHIIAYERVHGPVTPGLELDHLCRVRHCIRVDHLEPVTRAENNRRAQRVRWSRWREARA